MGFSINRGLGSWRGPSGEDRLFLVSHGNLVSLDAASGKPDAAFGNGRHRSTCARWARAGAVRLVLLDLAAARLCGDVVVVGNSTTDPYNYKTSPPGTIRGYDVRTGEDDVVVPHHPAGRRVRQRDLARRIRRLHRQRQRVDLDELRRGARLRLPADLDADRRLVRRPSSRRRPLRREPGRARRADRRAHVALPGGAPRPLGLRLPGGAHPGRRDRRRQAGQGAGAGLEAGVHLRASIAPPASRCGRSRSARCRSRTCPASAPSPTQPFPTKPPAFDRPGPDARRTSSTSRRS